MIDAKGFFPHPEDVILSQDYYTRATVTTDEGEVVRSAAEVAGQIADEIVVKEGIPEGSREHAALVQAALRGISIFASSERIEYPTEPQGRGLSPWQVLVRSNEEEAKMNEEGEK